MLGCLDNKKEKKNGFVNGVLNYLFIYYFLMKILESIEAIFFHHDYKMFKNNPLKISSKYKYSVKGL